MFLKKVYKEWRALFWAILVFIAAQAFFMYKGIENVPFFIYSMFSTVHPVKDSAEVILIKTKDGYISPFLQSNREAEMLINNVPYYNQLKRNGYADGINETIERRFKNRLPASQYKFVFDGLSNDSIAVNKYPQWWADYFSSVFDEGLDSVEVVKSYIYYQPSFHKSLVDSVIFSVSLKH